MSKWIPIEKQPYNGQRVLLSFANEKQKPLVGTWKVDDEGGAFYAVAENLTGARSTSDWRYKRWIIRKFMKHLGR